MTISNIFSLFIFPYSMPYNMYSGPRHSQHLWVQFFAGLLFFLMYSFKMCFFHCWGWGGGKPCFSWRMSSGGICNYIRDNYSRIYSDRRFFTDYRYSWADTVPFPCKQQSIWINRHTDIKLLSKDTSDKKTKTIFKHVRRQTTMLSVRSDRCCCCTHRKSHSQFSCWSNDVLQKVHWGPVNKNLTLNPCSHTPPGVVRPLMFNIICWQWHQKLQCHLG